jgi:hypothetical protein
MPTIEFLIEKKKINVGKYANLKAAAKKHGIHMGNGVVEVIEGLDNLTSKSLLEKFLLKSRPENIRLSGQAEVIGDICVITDYKPKPSRQ